MIDWGFAKEIEGGTTYTLCGTPEYLAPELVDGRGHGKAVDFWALGCVLFEMLQGFSPFVGDDANDTMAICHRITAGILEWPEGDEYSLEPSAKRMIERLLTSDPVERLGCLKDGIEEIYKDPFYSDAGFDWEAMREATMEAPWVPEIADEKDVSNFDGATERLREQPTHSDPQATQDDRPALSPPQAPPLPPYRYLRRRRSRS